MNFNEDQLGIMKSFMLSTESTVEEFNSIIERLIVPELVELVKECRDIVHTPNNFAENFNNVLKECKQKAVADTVAEPFTFQQYQEAKKPIINKILIQSDLIVDILTNDVYDSMIDGWDAKEYDTPVVCYFDKVYDSLEELKSLMKKYVAFEDDSIIKFKINKIDYILSYVGLIINSWRETEVQYGAKIHCGQLYHFLTALCDLYFIKDDNYKAMLNKLI